MASRDLGSLHPKMRDKVEAWLKLTPVSVLVYCCVREEWEQAQLYAQGRTQDKIDSGIARLRALKLDRQADLLSQQKPHPGPIVTRAEPGLSFHQSAWLEGQYGGLAIDFVPMLGGKPLWDDRKRYEDAALAAETVGLSWAGRWKTFRETPHLQLDYGGRLKIIPIALGEYR